MSFLRTLTLVISCITLLMSASLVLRFRWSRGGPLLWIFKSFSAALSPYTGIVAGICALTAMVTGSAATILISGTSVIISLVYLAGISAAPSRRTGFQSAFGPLWKERVVSKSSFLKRPATLLLPSDKKFILKRDIPYGSVEGTNRQLLCDLWLPSREVKPSGVAFIYLHGSAWCYLDKDTGTRTFFRHLASQGHVIMDVAYRLFPETDMTGMVQDAKRAIAWMKANAAGCHVNPHKVIIGGGSAGGQLAMLAAYLPGEEGFAPPELKEADYSVKGVVSLYGPADLEAQYYHLDQQFTTRPRQDRIMKAPPKESLFMKKMMGKDYYRLGMNRISPEGGAFASILGYHPDENPEIYEWYSPITHVKQNCPPTLIVQGEHDILNPVTASRRLFEKLKEYHVPVVMHILPQTDHAFDLFMPKISPVAHTAFFMVERFLALMETEQDIFYGQVKYSSGNGVLEKKLKQV